MTASPLEARCSVTPLEALRRLIEVAKWPDAHWFSSEEDWCAFQTQLAVAEMVLRDAAPPPASQPSDDGMKIPDMDNWNVQMACVKAMLGITDGELECIGEKLLGSYIEDVKRVVSAAMAKEKA